MKLVLIFGDSAVGKMTVGQELAKITGLRLFHNHVAIEPVLEVFGSFDGKVIARLRDVIFEEFAASDWYGLIFTYMFAFDMPSDWENIQRIKDLFLAQNPGTEFFHVELVAPLSVRLERNRTENRLTHKASKRDVKASEARMLADYANHRLESRDGEIPFENYIKIDNSNLTPEETALRIKEHFQL